MSITVNGIKIEPTKFSDGTSQVWQIDTNILDYRGAEMKIVWDFENEGEIFQLMQLNTLLKHGRIPHPISLHMPFLPYGRQDKRIANDATFALQTFAEIINGMRFSKVTSLDTHSDVAETLINGFKNIFPDRQIRNVVNELNADDLIPAYPDAGAFDRYYSLDRKINSIIVHKERNQLTGYIEKYRIDGESAGKDILIIDDICDGGMTFILMAKELYRQGAKSVSLYVTHGIFSKGLKPLKESGIVRIFTKDGEVFPSKDTNFLIKELK